MWAINNGRFLMENQFFLFKALLIKNLIYFNFAD